MPPAKKRKLSQPSEDDELKQDVTQMCLEILQSDIIDNEALGAGIGPLFNSQKITKEIDPKIVKQFKEWEIKEYYPIIQKNKPNLPKVNVNELLILLHILKTAKTNTAAKDEIKLFLSQVRWNSGETFWGTAAPILCVFRQCILTRNWDYLTKFCICLLQQDVEKYDVVVKKIVKIMIKLNPKILESGLMEQFSAVLKENAK